MQDRRNRWRGITAVLIALFAAGLATGCADQATQVSQANDSPVSSKGTGLAVTGVPAPPPSKPHDLVVEHGQSLNGIAHFHHVTPAALAAANHLQPPYKLKVGSRLVLPDTGPPPLQEVNAASAPHATPLPPSTPPSAPAAAAAPQPVPPSAAPINGPPKESAAAQQLQAPTPAPAVLPWAPPVLPPRNPAAALPLPGEAP